MVDKFKKETHCKYCEKGMDAVYRSKRFCSARCRVYYSRENKVAPVKPNKPQESIKKENKGIVKTDVIFGRKEMPPGLDRVAQMRWIRENS